MRKLKYLLLTLLALAIIVTGLTLTVSAEAATEVATADAFVEAFGNAEVASIKLTADIDLGTTVLPEITRALTVDLNGFTLSAVGAGVTDTALFKVTAAVEFNLINGAEIQAHINTDRKIIDGNINGAVITIACGEAGIKFGHSYNLASETANTGASLFSASANKIRFYVSGKFEAEIDTVNCDVFATTSDSAALYVTVQSANVKVYPTATRATNASVMAFAMARTRNANAGYLVVNIDDSEFYLNRTNLLYNGYYNRQQTVTATKSTFVMGDADGKTVAPNATVNALLYMQNYASKVSAVTFTNCNFVGDNQLFYTSRAGGNDLVNLTGCKFELASYAYSPATSTILNYDAKVTLTNCEFKGYNSISITGSAWDGTRGTLVTGTTTTDKPLATNDFVKVEGDVIVDEGNDDNEELSPLDAFTTAFNNSAINSIILTADVDLGTTVLPEITRALTIDLNGFTLSAVGEGVTDTALFKVTAVVEFNLINGAQTQAHINTDRKIIDGNINGAVITIACGEAGIKFGHSYNLASETANTGASLFSASANKIRFYVSGKFEAEIDTVNCDVFATTSDSAALYVTVQSANVKVYPTATRATNASVMAFAMARTRNANAGYLVVNIDDSEFYLNRTNLLYNGYYNRQQTVTATKSTFVMGDADGKTVAPNATVNALLYMQNYASKVSAVTFTNCNFVGDNQLFYTSRAGGNDLVNLTGCKFELASYAYSPATSTILNYDAKVTLTNCEFKGYNSIAIAGSAWDGTRGTLVTGNDTVADRAFATNRFVKLDGTLGCGFNPLTHEADTEYRFGYNSVPFKQSTFTSDTSILEIWNNTSYGALDFVTADGNSYADFNYGDKYTDGSLQPSMVLDGIYSGANYPQFDKYVSYDFDISSSGNGYLDLQIRFYGRNSYYTETMNADGTTTISGAKTSGGTATGATGPRYIYIQDGVLRLYVEGTATYTLPEDANEWTHITVVIETVDNGDGSFGGVQSLFVNGELLASFEDSAMFGTPIYGAWSDGTGAAGATRRVDAYRYSDVRFNVLTAPEYDEETLDITSKENLLVDNVAVVKYNAASDIGEAVKNGETFAVKDAIFQSNYKMPNVDTPIQNVNGKDCYSYEAVKYEISTTIKNNLSLYADFVYNVYIPTSVDISKLTINDVEMTLSDANTYTDPNTGIEYYVASLGLPASSALDDLVIKFWVDGSDREYTITTSIPKYAEKVLADETQTEVTKSLMTATLNYINAAYAYFKPDEGITVEDIDDRTYESFVLDNNVLKVLSGAQLSLDGEISFKFNIQSQTDYTGDLTFGYMLNGKATTKTYTYEEWSTLGGAIFLNLKASDITSDITITVEGGEMTYNLGNYIDAMQKEYQGEDKAQLLDLL